MQINELSRETLAAAFSVHTALGSGLLERSYQVCLAHELRLRGLAVDVEVGLPVEYRGVTVELGYRIDIVVEKLIAVEVKAVSALLDVHRSQVITQLKFSGLPLGLLLNFHAQHLRDGIKRIIMPHAVPL
jgi:GxxExxY protein